MEERQPTRPAAEPVIVSTVNNTKSAGEVRLLPLHTTSRVRWR